MSASNFVHLDDVNVKRITANAVLIKHDGAEHWIPKSQLAPGEAEKIEVGDDDITLSITEWIAEQKGIDS